MVKYIYYWTKITFINCSFYVFTKYLSLSLSQYSISTSFSLFLTVFNFSHYSHFSLFFSLFFIFLYFHCFFLYYLFKQTLLNRARRTSLFLIVSFFLWCQVMPHYLLSGEVAKAYRLYNKNNFTNQQCAKRLCRIVKIPVCHAR